MWIKVQKVLCMFVGTDDVAISVADVQHIHCGTWSLHFPPPILSLALIQASLSTGLWSGCKQAVWWSPLRQQRYWISHTLSGQPDGDVQHYTLALPLVLCIGPAHVAGLIIGTWRGHVPQCKKKERRKKTSLWRTVLSWLEELRKFCNSGNCSLQYQEVVNNSVSFQNILTKFCMAVAKLFSIISCTFNIAINNAITCAI